MTVKILARMRGRNGLVLVDTAIASITNIATLLFAARLLSPHQLALFSAFQLIVMTGVGIQRATFLYPALAAQKTHGKAVVPVRWCINVSLPAGILLGAITSLLLGLEFQPLLGLLAVAGSVSYLLQDVVRYNFFSRGRPIGAVVADAVGLLAIGACWVALTSSNLPRSWVTYGWAWTVSGYVTFVVALFVINRDRQPHDFQSSRLRSAFALGRWSGADAALSGVASIGPIIASTIVLTSSVAGTYRVFQSALGPLNVLSTSLVTIIGLDAWYLNDRTALAGFRVRIRNMSAILCVGSAIYIGVASFFLLELTDVSGPETGRVVLFVAIAGCVGGLTIPFSAGANALGMQKIGLVLRIVVLGAAAVLVVLSTSHVWLPWDDPVGLLMIVSSVVNAVGWIVAFRLGVSRQVGPGTAPPVNDIVIMEGPGS